MRIFALIGTIVLGMLFIHPAVAAERRATSLDLRNTVDPVGTWRVIRADGATSDCIGDPITPICAIETELACFHRQIVELCLLAHQTSDPHVFNLNLSDGSEDVYRIEKIKRVNRLTPLEQKMLARDGDRHPNMMRIGDLIVHLRSGECAKSRDACTREPLDRFACNVRQTGRTWQVLGCSGEGFPD